MTMGEACRDGQETKAPDGHMQFGIDLSHHQNPASLPWSRFEGTVDFVICRAAYGAGLRDRQVEEHVRRARSIGARVGLYLLYRPLHSIAAQWDLFRCVADQVRLGEGDLVPALDVEHDPLPRPGVDVSGEWSGPCQELAARMRESFGRPLIYLTQREWSMMGKPGWVLEHPLWVAHYTGAARPATPNGVSPTIWQYRVGPYDPQAPGGYDSQRPELDHNRALSGLPLIESRSADSLPDQDLDDLRDSATLRLFNA
jgi:GH25 family lysozyme M1 (1,4-beta-N-acetylmuramidase)